MPPKAKSRVKEDALPPKAKRRVKEEALPPEALDINSNAFFDMNPFLVQFLTKAGSDIASGANLMFNRQSMESFNSILNFKSEFKTLCEEVSGKRSVPKTPKRSALAKISETIALFDDVIQSAAVEEQIPSASISEIEERQDEVAQIQEEAILESQVAHNEETTVEQPQKAEVVIPPVSDASIHDGDTDMVEEQVFNAELQIPVVDPVQESSDVLQEETKEEKIVPPSRKSTLQRMRSRIKEEPMDGSFTSGTDLSEVPQLAVQAPSSAIPSPEVRSKARVVVSNTKRPVEVKEEVVSPIGTAATDVIHAKEEKRIPRGEERAFAGKTTPIRSRYAHQHIVTTPGKADRKDHVQKVIAEQDLARNRSPLRKPHPYQINDNKKKLQENAEMKRTDMDLKMQMAAQKKELENRERAERIRKQTEENQMRVRQNALRLAEEKKKEREKKNIMRQERVKSPSRIPISRVASPARCNPISRVASPSRCKPALQNPSTPRLKSKQELFTNTPVRTPGRGPAKASKVTLLSGESSREGTYSSPAREVKRKQLRPKEECDDIGYAQSSDNLKSDERHRVETARELRELRDFEEREREEMRRQQEDILLKQQLDKERREASRRMKEGEQLRARELEAQRIQQEELRRLEEMKENRIDDIYAQRKSVKKQVELNNKHLANVSLTVSTDSYEMTPEKTYKPSSLTNYNIEDLSSGDETDDDTAPRKKVPTWADWNNLKVIAKKQHNISKCYQVYGPPIHPETCTVFAKGTAKLKKRRGSSAQWNSPLEKPTKGKSRYLGF